MVLFIIAMKLLSSLPLAERLPRLGMLLSRGVWVLTSDYIPTRGRGIGGTSAINLMIYQKPPAVDVDAWERLGSPGWNWENHHASTKKAETYVYDPYHRFHTSQSLVYHSLHLPPKEIIDKFGLVFNPESFGTNGQSLLISNSVQRRSHKSACFGRSYST